MLNKAMNLQDICHWYAYVPNSNKRFCLGYTRQKQTDGFFYAFVDRYIASRKRFKRAKLKRFKSRWKAKDFAYLAYCKYSNKPFNTLHRPRKTINLPLVPKKGENPFEKEYLCIDNKGLENQYDIGVEYLGIPAKGEDSKDFIYIEDNFGKRNKVAKERFEIVKQISITSKSFGSNE